MRAIDWEDSNITIAEDQEEYHTLKGLRLDDNYQTIVTCWEPSWRDIIRMVWYRRLWMRSLTFGRPFTPMNLGTDRKDFYSLPTDKL